MFKNSASGKTISVRMDINMPINSIRTSVNTRVVSELNVRENYKIILGRQNLMEFASNIDETSDISILDLVGDIHSLGFYITPDSFANTRTSTTCSVCFDTFIHSRQTRFTCGHDKNICSSCIISWTESCDRNGKLKTCPICRTTI